MLSGKHKKVELMEEQDPVKTAKANAPGVQYITLENGHKVWTQTDRRR